MWEVRRERENSFGEYERFDESGSHFRVLVFENYVVKIPRDETNRAKLDEMEEVQNYLAERVDGILPVERVDDLLVMPRAPGTRADELRDQWLHIRDLKSDVHEEVQDHGWVILDIGTSDIFSDAADEQVYLVDFSQIKPYEDVFG